tara:strand:- start:4606 stop:5100 length:495 start_codon:yes stop_codon:yes gene_type:complete
MNFNGIYLPDIIIFYIYDKIDDNDCLNFTHINKYTYKNLKIKNKYKIFKFINKDFKLFKQYINTYKYNKEEINNIGLISAINIIEVRTTLYNYYDLRFLFEALYRKSKIDTNLVLDKTLIYIIECIKKCISFNRFETIFNINNDLSLYPLHYNFIPNDDGWIYI